MSDDSPMKLKPFVVIDNVTYYDDDQRNLANSGVSLRMRHPESAAVKVDFSALKGAMTSGYQRDMKIDVSSAVAQTNEFPPEKVGGAEKVEELGGKKTASPSFWEIRRTR